MTTAARARRGLLAAALGLAGAGATWAQPAPPRGGTPIEFKARQHDDRVVPLRGLLYEAATPARAAVEAAAPARAAVVMLHGSGAWSDHREGHHARALQQAAFTVLLVDSFGPRGVTSTVEDQTRVASIHMAADALGARRALVARGADPARTAVVGFSKGGTAALMASDRTHLPAEAERFAAAVPFYPGCSSRPMQPRPAAVLRLQIGERDDYTGVKPCQDLVADVVAAGGRATVRVHPGAGHGFDGDPNLLSMTTLRWAENHRDCVVPVDAQARHQLQGRSYALDDPALFEVLRRTCMRRGATIWTSPAARRDATQDTIEFLSAQFPAR